MTEIRVTSTALCIESLECADADVIAFFAEASEPSRTDLACRALALGVVGLRAMGIAGHVEIVEREFLKLSQRFDSALGAVESNLLARVQATFDPDQAESVSARLSTTVNGAHAAAGEVVTQARAELAALIGDSFNPDLATSCVYRITKLVADTRAQLDRAFDPAYEGSHLARLAAMVDSYFGEDGSLADLVAGQVGPVKAELLQALQGVRELIVGQAMAAEERHRSPASGLDFEDEVEAVLCRLASAYGDTVERVGTQPGDTGRSKRGDFVVQLSGGARFVVEAKKRSTPLPVRGDRGVLAILEESMLNRGATFAVAVAKDHRAFAREVGAFNDYDTNKVLCHFGDDGELLEVAYRWARSTLLLGSAGDEGVDVTVIGNSIEEARRAMRELARIEAKAKAIAHGADEIQGLLSFQVRRMNAALDDAAAGLANKEDRAASLSRSDFSGLTGTFMQRSRQHRKDVTAHGPDQDLPLVWEGVPRDKSRGRMVRTAHRNRYAPSGLPLPGRPGLAPDIKTAPTPTTGRPAAATRWPGRVPSRAVCSKPPCHPATPQRLKAGRGYGAARREAALVDLQLFADCFCQVDP